MSCHDLGATLCASFVEYLVQDCLLLIPVAVVGGLWSDDQILLLIAIEEHVVRRLWQLVHCHGGGCTAVNLLQKIVLLLAHHLIASRLLLPSLQLVLQTLGIDANPGVADNLLACIGCNAAAAANSRQLPHAL